MHAFATAQEVEAYFASWDLRAEVWSYLTIHSTRYSRLVQSARAARAGTRSGETAQILDVGTFLQTELLRRGVPEALIHSSSHPSVERWGAWGPIQEGAQHFSFDLNNSQDRERWGQAGPYDVVVMAEVIEHLYTAPTLVLACVASWLAPGGRLVIQTPNAIALDKRVRLLCGRHPYDTIKEDPAMAGHFREYTVAELEAVAGAAGLRLIDCTVENYFALTTPRRRALKRVTGLLPPSLRDGITATFQRA
jgi:SAM-dependent methyltransferase